MIDRQIKGFVSTMYTSPKSVVVALLLLLSTTEMTDKDNVDAIRLLTQNSDAVPLLKLLDYT